jgi:hypothetical protein
LEQATMGDGFVSEQEKCACRFLQGLEQQSADGHDSDHRGPAVVAFGAVSGTEAGVWLRCRDFVDLQGLAQQSTGGHDSEHRGPAFVASGIVSWNRGDDGATDVFAVD